ncbi:hypothetical protein PP707_07395 [Acetobacter pasteurianus]|nr:hypothetical protein [Acetobacter pasteurianus]
MSIYIYTYIAVQRISYVWCIHQIINLTIHTINTRCTRNSIILNVDEK